MARSAPPYLTGILNVTRDSFSDGGRFIDPERALAQARRLLEDGADIIDVGAESTHPDSEDVSEDEEIRRLAPVVEALVAEGVTVSVDTCKAAVMERVLAQGAGMINDVTALADAGAVAAVRHSDARICVMYSRARGHRAERGTPETGGAVSEILAFFETRVEELVEAGIARGRLILDPGMGFFLGTAPGPSLAVLRELPRLARETGLPLLVSTSRKSFIGEILDREVADRGPGTLATELWAVSHGASYIRTHDVRPLADALALTEAIRDADPGA